MTETCSGYSQKIKNVLNFLSLSNYNNLQSGELIMHNFSWLIPGVLAGSSRPRSVDLQRLSDEGIRVLVTVMLNPLNIESVVSAGLEYYHIPVPDFGTPTLEQIQEFVDIVNENRRKGKPVAVHCLMGCGRTGTFLAAYLISQGKSFEEAVQEVRRKRPCSIETRGQMDILRRFAEQHLHHTKH
ncbi:MAG: dual specificity protein phosphatase 23 [Candidatus Jordarchaeum sp.]|uniref:dual specificity protein phosphatase 23 n=1 Tax=Candidatus Jordarchaeum sp. TaxID=2823881 RepID=UPI0040492819